MRAPEEHELKVRNADLMTGGYWSDVGDDVYEVFKLWEKKLEEHPQNWWKALDMVEDSVLHRKQAELLSSVRKKLFEM